MSLAEAGVEPVRLDAEEYAAVERLLATSAWALAHVHQVARLAARLFDALRPYHACGEEAERMLVAAALLHDVGYPTDPDRHHKVSARLIRTMLGPPFDPHEVELIALIARYHRKSCPKVRKHRRYQALSPEDRSTVNWLGGMLRVADGLDRAHESAVGAVAAVPHDGRLVLRVHPAGETPEPADVLAEDVAGAMRKRDLLEKALGLSVTVRAA
jgi:exopolyphosphatase/guanosine-5'-triphosphate,3'-diphosphate pyrophosphatase